ncbi:hypothetical protein [Chryseobacterium koreense]|uniref:Secretion system C-terminal sorting domain-containing protein n=1 Tax=Chryseobacterium koreense CCUG 49689 TaxID=1304281 RepID=A0A0J7LSI9_9FLAO|nr:hypothetical protein [Chryseobacterium koreense]KMQ71935.1 hypothetical protein ACM44_04675 [Chryseobacterium koreense CCUG 49689]MBB5334104.1 hypothetical protein [Chryseobacterium koreense]
MTKTLQIFSKMMLPCAIAASALYSAQTTFSQDFSSSTTVSDYVTTPAAGTSDKFDGISTSGSGVSWSAAGNNLKVTRGTANAGSLTRMKVLGTTPTAMSIVFDLSVSATLAQTTAATFYVGDGLTTANTGPANANSNSRLGVSLTTTDGNFTLRNIVGSANSAVLSGVQKISWMINSGTTDMSYTAPDGTTKTLVAGKSDVWAGNTIVFDGMAATTSTVPLNDFKYVFSAGTGSMTMDNFVIKPLVDPTLATSTIAKDNTIIATNNGSIVVSSDEKISSVKVYDFAGRNLANTDVNAKSANINVSAKMAIVEVTLASGKKLVKKVRL